jgi:hypothetical protein
MDQDGFCQYASVANLAHRALIGLEETKKAVAILEAPDPDSSDPDHEGRRIERVPGGWIVINAQKYRDLASREIEREKTRIRVAAFRERHKGNADVTPTNGRVSSP